ncbi:TIGR03943 family putative permease subunit [Saccharococcus thermophilus]|uniref:Putative membrane protein n=1 Tax=Saccharococcus thermophilus TaxID=29396 RepID=A0A846MHT9_9BACL|nr:putative membrane protein [Saccharococcus thermophilus]
MLRMYILLGFTFLFFHLYITGEISKYINMRYSYLSFSAIFVFALLTIIQFIFVSRKQEHDHCDDDACCHHHHEEQSRWKRAVNYMIFIFPIVSALLFPVATLDSEMVKAKGFHIPGMAADSGDPFVQRQFLRPDTSIYYGKDDYNDLMQKELKKYGKVSRLKLDPQNYLNVMETIYQFPGQFDERDIEFDGFVYHDETTKANQVFVLRFGIIHCVADSGVYGLLTEFPQQPRLKNDEWIHVKGTLSTVYYQPFHMNIPYVKVTSWQRISEPKEPYVFRQYNQ